MNRFSSSPKNQKNLRRSFRTWIGILFLLGIPLFFLFQYRTWTRSLPQTKGEIVFSPLSTPVHIFRDGYSIPHIFSKSEYDLFFAQGFVTAQDRLWQMDIFRRIAKGQLSELFGEKTLATDSLMRFIGMYRLAHEWKSSLSEISQTILQAYTDGVNAAQNQMPIETRFLNYKIDPWTSEDCLAVYLLFAFQSDIRWIAEPFLIAMANPKKLSTPFYSYLRLFSRSLEQFFIGFFPTGMACGISSCKTETGQPLLLAFLPVSQISIPTFWYEIYLSSPQVHVRGFSIPGFPLVWSGFNGKFAWIGTASGEKDLHLSIVQIGKSRNWTSHTEWITVKNKEKRAFHFSLYSGKPVFIASPHQDSIGLQVDWTWPAHRDVPLGFYRLAQANDLLSFQKAVEQISIPPTLWMYGDTSGNLYGLFLKKGKYQCIKPKDVLFVTDFQIGDLTTRLVIGEELSTPFRIERLSALCKEKKIFSGVDMKAIAMDQVSPLAVRFLQRVFPKITPEILHDSLTQKAFGLLSQWKGDMNPGSGPPLIIETWMHELISTLFKNTMEEHVFLLFSKIPLLPYQFLMQWIENPPVDSETEKAVLIQSFRNTLQTIKAQWGEDPLSWNWANGHTLTFHHPLEEYSLLKRILSAGPFPLGGSCHTLSGWMHDFQFPFRILSGHGVRMLVDLKNPDYSVTILSTGQSGQALDGHYRDQLPLFLTNCYHPALWDSLKITRSGWKKLILKPKDSL